MKPGDMVTWKQRPDLRGEGFPPYRRLGLILQRDPPYQQRDFEVLWLESQNTTYHNEDGLEVVNASR
jgi:hypothetical protein